MIEVIRSYMDDQVTAFQFDEMLAEIGSETEDKTVQTFVRKLWFYYDDLKDHNIVASKQVWDYFNRLLLLLASDAEIQVVKVWRSWHASHMVAAISLACFFFLVVRTGTRWGGRSVQPGNSIRRCLHDYRLVQLPAKKAGRRNDKSRARSVPDTEQPAPRSA